MARIFKALFFLIIVAAFASPYAASMLIEKHYNQMIQRLNDYYKGKIKFTGTFKRGYINSSAITEISSDGPDKITLNHSILNGPVFLKFDGWLNTNSYIPQGYGVALVNTKFTGGIESAINSLYGGKQAYTMQTIFDLHGDSKTNIKNFALNTAVGPGQLNWQGFDAVITLTKDSLDKTIDVPLIEYTEIDPDSKNSQTLHVSGINGKFKIVHNTASLDFTNDLQINNIKITNNNATDLNLDLFTYSMNANGKNDIYDVSFNANMKKMDFNNASYGPLVCNVNMKNIDLKSAEDVKNKLVPTTVQAQIPVAQNQSTAPTAAAPTTTPSMPPPANVPTNNEQKKVEAATTEMQNVLSSQPSVTVNFKLNTSYGNIDFDSQTATVVENGTKKITEHAKAQFGDKLFYTILANYAVGQIQFSEKQYFINNRTSNTVNPYTMSPEQLEAATTMWVTALLDQLNANKIIITKDEIVTIDVSYVNDIFTINGEQKTQAQMDQLKSFYGIKIPTVNDIKTLPKAKPSDKQVIPSTTAPSTTAPSTTAPSTTAPSTTAPSTTAPSTTAPSTTAPSTTAPSTTAPSTTAPSTTVPSTTVPTTTVPSTTPPTTQNVEKVN